MFDKTAIILFSDTEHPGSHGRFIHAFTAAKELKDAGRDFKVVFEGIGVTWLGALHLRDHPVAKAYGHLFDEVRDHVMGACYFCTTKRFEMGDSAEALGIPMLTGHGEHFSIGTLVDEGYQIITY